MKRMDISIATGKEAYLQFVSRKVGFQWTDDNNILEPGALSDMCSVSVDVLVWFGFVFLQ